MPAVPSAVIPQATPTAVSVMPDAGRGTDQAAGSAFRQRLQGAVGRQGSPPTSPGAPAPATLSAATLVGAAAPPPAPEPADAAGAAPADGEPTPPSAGAQVQPPHAQPGLGLQANVALSASVSTKASRPAEQAGSSRLARPATQASSKPQQQPPAASSEAVELEPASPLPPEPAVSAATVPPGKGTGTAGPPASLGHDTRDVRTPPHTLPEADTGAASTPTTVPSSPETRAPAVTAATETVASPTAATQVPVAIPPTPELAPAAHIKQAMAPAALPERAAPGSPVQQIAAPLVALGTAPDGAQRLTVRLDPEALGSVEVHVDRPKDGPARVAITVERPETLTLLLRDGVQLQQALDHAGIPPEGRSLTFHVADTAPRADTSLSGNSPDPGTGRAGDGGGGTRRERSGGGEPLPDRRPRTLRWSRAGLDITA